MYDTNVASLIRAGRDGEPLDGTAARALNAVLAQIDASCTSEEVLALPSQHYVSVSDTCDLRCRFCPRQSLYGDRWENGFLPFERFDECITSLVHVAQVMGLYGLGEPFLHRRFFDFVRSSHGAGAQTLTNCHGMSLRPQVNDEIIASGLDILNLSMDGATERTFNHLRGGADFVTVCANVRDLVARREAADSETPHLQIAAMINRRNVAELPDIVRMAEDLGVERVDFSDTVICDPADLEDSVSGLAEMHRAVEEAKATGRELDITVQYTLQKPFPWRPLRPDELGPQPQVCELVWSTWLVGKGGQVNPCCFIEWEFGNAFTDDPERIRNGPEARTLRRRLMSGDLPRECRGCGCAFPLTARHQREALDEAERMIDASDLPEEECSRLRATVAERRRVVEERWGNE